MFFDQGVFENERFFFRVGGQEIDGHHGGQAQADMVAWVTALREILPDPVAEIFGLAHIDDLSDASLINRRRGRRKPLDLLTYIHGASPVLRTATA